MSSSASDICFYLISSLEIYLKSEFEILLKILIGPDTNFVVLTNSYLELHILWSCNSDIPSCIVCSKSNVSLCGSKRVVTANTNPTNLVDFCFRPPPQLTNQH